MKHSWEPLYSFPSPCCPGSLLSQPSRPASSSTRPLVEDLKFRRCCLEAIPTRMCSIFSSFDLDTNTRHCYSGFYSLMHCCVFSHLNPSPANEYFVARYQVACFCWTSLICSVLNFVVIDSFCSSLICTRCWSVHRNNMTSRTSRSHGSACIRIVMYQVCPEEG